MTAVKVTLRTIGARLLWDGRAENGRAFIPGIGHYQAGVQVLQAAAGSNDRAAARSLSELDEALSAAEGAVRRWHRSVEHFVGESLKGASCAERAWLREEQSIRAWRPEVQRLAQLIAAYDEACALTSMATERARVRGIFNPHHESIRARAGQPGFGADLGLPGALRGWSLRVVRVGDHGGGAGGRVTAVWGGPAEGLSVGLRLSRPTLLLVTQISESASLGR